MTDASAEGLPVVLLDRNLWVISANRSFYRAFRVSRRKIQGRSLCLLGEGYPNMRSLLTQLESFARRSVVVEPCEVKMDIVSVYRRTMQVNARKIVCDQESQDKIVVIFEDITDRRADVPADAGNWRNCEIDHDVLVSSRPS